MIKAHAGPCLEMEAAPALEKDSHSVRSRQPDHLNGPTLDASLGFCCELGTRVLSKCFKGTCDLLFAAGDCRARICDSATRS
jgi:hypothetical protein